MAENPYDDQINTTMDPGDKTAIKAAFDLIKEKMAPYLADIPVEERKKGHKIGNKRRNFAQEANDAGHDHPEVLAPVFEIVRHDNDRSLEGDLEDVLTWSSYCQELINDTHLIVGREYYAGARLIYKYVQTANGLDELKAKLGEYFEQAQAEEAQDPPADPEIPA